MWNRIATEAIEQLLVTNWKRSWFNVEYSKMKYDSVGISQSTVANFPLDIDGELKI